MERLRFPQRSTGSTFLVAFPHLPSGVINRGGPWTIPEVNGGLSGEIIHKTRFFFPLKDGDAGHGDVSRDFPANCG